MYQQKVGLILSSKYFTIDKEVGIGIVVLKVEPPELNWHIFLLLFAVKRRIEGIAVVKLADPVISRCRVDEPFFL